MGISRCAVGNDKRVPLIGNTVDLVFPAGSKGDIDGFPLELVAYLDSDDQRIVIKILIENQIQCQAVPFLDIEVVIIAFKSRTVSF